MSIVTLGTATLEEARRRLAGAFRGEPQGAFIAFGSEELLWKLVTAKRMDILRKMAGQGPLVVRDIARRVGRDIKAVHGDLQALLAAGIIDRAETGVVFRYDAVHVDFVLGRAA